MRDFISRTDFSNPIAKALASINNMNELNIGHSIVARALAIGLEKSVREMKSLITLN